VLLHCWLGHLTCKIVSEMTYEWDVKPYNTNTITSTQYKGVIPLLGTKQGYL